MSYLRQQAVQPQSNPNTTFIYGLVDPRTGHVRYVGKSHNPKNRLQNHLTPRQLKSKSHKNSWLRGLLDSGYKPRLVLLEEVNESKWQEAERRWIVYYRSLPGYPPLTNGTSGGDGIDKGTKFGDETRKKLSEMRRGKKMPPFTDEHRRKISEANKAAWQNFSEEDRNKRLKSLRDNPKPKKVRVPKIKKTHRFYPDKTKSSSKFRGVCAANVGKPWRAFCSFQGKLRHLGCFTEEEDAARAFDRFVIENGITDAQTNFPRDSYK